MKYRKKPVVIEAVRVRDITSMMLESTAPRWLLVALGKGTVVDLVAHVVVHTLEGAMRGELDDWLICGVKGEIYPCKPDVFEATYEAVD